MQPARLPTSERFVVGRYGRIRRRKNCKTSLLHLSTTVDALVLRAIAVACAAGIAEAGTPLRLDTFAHWHIHALAIRILYDEM
jgi:hypothetical protein